MPQGKGTYGGQVGSPPKKKYQAGGNVDPFSTRNSEGVPSEQIMEAIEKQNMLPESNEMERSETSPDTTEYKEGGVVAKVKEDIRTRVQDVRHRVGEKAKKRQRLEELSKADKEFKKEYSKRRKKADKQTKKALKAKDPSSSTNILDITHDVQGSEIEMEKISKKRNTH